MRKLLDEQHSGDILPAGAVQCQACAVQKKIEFESYLGPILHNFFVEHELTSSEFPRVGLSLSLSIPLPNFEQPFARQAN